MGAFRQWIVDEYRHDRSDHLLISDMDNVYTAARPDIEAFWFEIGGIIFSISKPGRYYEIDIGHPNEKQIDVPLSDRVQDHHKYDQQLEGVDFSSYTPPGSNSQCPTTIRSAVNVLYDAIKCRTDCTTWRQIDSGDDYAAMRPLGPTNQTTSIFQEITGHAPSRGFTMDKGNSTYLFRCAAPWAIAKFVEPDKKQEAYAQLAVNRI